MNHLPEPVAAAIEAANANDTAAFLACFMQDGVVDDWGREFRGPDEIRDWSDREFIGVRVSLDVTASSARTARRPSPRRWAARASTVPATSRSP